MAGCSDENKVGDACAGVPAQPLCEGNSCTAGACSSTIEVSNPDSAQAQIDAAAAGSCIALSPGVYGELSLPASVSIFGRGADHVTAAKIASAGGSDVRISGITIDGGGLTMGAEGTGSVTGVRVRDSSGDGITLGEQSDISIENSEISGSMRYGISAFDTSALEVEGVIVSQNRGPGLWAQCTGGCGCTGVVDVSVSGSRFNANEVVGVALVGVKASLDNVEVQDSTVGANFQHGGGVSVSGCSDLTASRVRVARSADFGLLVDDSKAIVTDSEVNENLRGMWVQRIGASSSDASVALDGVLLQANQGVGIGVDGGSLGVIIANTDIFDTTNVSLPVLVDGVSAGAEDVGDGLAWLGVSQVVISGMNIQDSARVSLLIDGDVATGSSIANLDVATGSNGAGVVQQNAGTGNQPSIDGSTTITMNMDEFAVPTAVAVPPGI